jgi:hypothetical protein
VAHGPAIRRLIYSSRVPLLRRATVEQLATELVERQQRREKAKRLDLWRRWREARYLRQLGRADLRSLMEATVRRQGAS